MDPFYRQLQFLHNLLPYFPASNRTFISYLLYFLELRHLLTAFQEEQEVLRSAPDEPDFPDQDTLLHIMTDQMPQSDAKRVQNMMEILKMMEAMEAEAPPPPSEPSSSAQTEPGFQEKMDQPRHQSASPPVINNDLLKNMMTPKQQELFQQYQTMFQK
jgi:hypothetical protein